MTRKLLAALALGLLVLPAEAGDPDAPAPTTVAVRTNDTVPGAVLPGPPADLGAPRGGPVTLDEVRQHMQAGDTARALRAARVLAQDRTWGRQGDAASMVVGLLERGAGRHNAASQAFTRVRLSEGPLGPWGAWYEAEQDLARGKPWVAVRECERYRDRWPEGPHAQACLHLTARAWATLGRETPALAAAEAYDDEHEDAPITEQVDLELAAWQAEHEPHEAVDRLRRLAIEHTAPLTGRYAEELLADLAAQGIEGAALPDDTDSLKRRALSLRDARRRGAAHEVWRELEARASDDPALSRWLHAQAPAFGWRIRAWELLADHYRAEYEDHPTGDTAWDLYRVLGRGGGWSEAADVALAAQQAHGHTRRWKYSQEEVGRTLMLAGRYDEATAQYEKVVRRGGWIGRRARYEAAFSTWMAGDAEGAVERFDAIIERDRSWVTESRYWRAQALQALDRADEAAADRRWILGEDPDSWYALLVHQEAPLPSAVPFARDGRWPGPSLPDPPGATPRPTPPDPAMAAPVAPAPGLADVAAFGTLGWPMRVGPPLAASEPRPAVQQNLLAPPPSYRSGPFFDADEAHDDLYAFSEQYGHAWPVLPAVHDLAAAGLYDLAGPLFSQFFEDWYRALRYRWHAQHVVARGMHMTQDDWRPLFLTVRDHHHTARFTHGLHEDTRDPAARRQALELAWPLAHDRYVWSHSREHDVDPYLVLALMRQESNYNPNALSRAGARGAMQIMPRTGHLLADLSHDTRFTAGDLEDPTVAIGYGLRYLGLLMQRFDGVYPLAIASYNGGPHNVSSWLDGTGAQMPLDRFVEHIPFRETRNYVKKVSANYATYLALYTPEGTQVVLPEHPRGDDPSIVDF